MKINMREVNWAIQRMRRIITVWRKLDSADRMFLFSKFRDEYPKEFWEAANECRERRA